MVLKDMQGKKVRCTRGWKSIGLKRGGEYTVALAMDGLYLSAGDVVENPSNKLGPDGPTAPQRISVRHSGTVQFQHPMYFIAELNFAIPLDADRFEEVRAEAR